jgi:hypothetical protein
MMTRKKRRILLLFSSIAFFLAAAAIISYSQGYSLDNKLRLTRKGGLYISAPLSGSDIFVNNKKERTTGMLNSGLFLGNLKGGEYALLVAKEGFWPWAKTIEVEPGKVSEARAIMLPKNPEGKMLFKGKLSNVWASSHNKVLALKEEKNGFFQLSFYLPEENTYLNSANALTEKLLIFNTDVNHLSWQKNSLTFKTEKGAIRADLDLDNKTVNASYAEGPLEEISDYEKYTRRGDEKIWWNPQTHEVFINWLSDAPPPYYICSSTNCKLPIKIFQSQFAVKNIDFFPQRKDAILVAVGNGVYALEVDGRGGRLIYPIYKGKEPTFASFGSNAIYILDEGALLSVQIR